MRKLLLLLSLFITTAVTAQNTVTLPTGTTAYTPQFRYIGTDSLKQVWVYTGSGYNQWPTYTQMNKYFGRLNVANTWQQPNNSNSYWAGTGFITSAFAPFTTGDAIFANLKIGNGSNGIFGGMTIYNNNVTEWQIGRLVGGNFGLNRWNGTSYDNIYTASASGALFNNDVTLNNFALRLNGAGATTSTIQQQNGELWLNDGVGITSFKNGRVYLRNNMGTLLPYVLQSEVATAIGDTTLYARKIGSADMVQKSYKGQTINVTAAPTTPTTGVSIGASGTSNTVLTWANANGRMTRLESPYPNALRQYRLPYQLTNTTPSTLVDSARIKTYTDSVANSVAVNSVTYSSGTGASNTFTTATIVNRFVDGVWRDGQEFVMITSGSPVGNQVLVNTSTGAVTFQDVINSGEYIKIRYRNALGLSPPATSGKNILWLGTSIPKQNYPNSYPDIAGAKVGANVNNQALPSSMMRVAKKDGTINGLSWVLFLRSLSKTIAECNYIYANWNNSTGTPIGTPPTTWTASLTLPISGQLAAASGVAVPTNLDAIYTEGRTYYQDMVAASYEHRLLPFLRNTRANSLGQTVGNGYDNGVLVGAIADIVIFDHGYNDYQCGTLNGSPTDTQSDFVNAPSTRNNYYYFFGAFNRMADFIFAADPLYRCGMISHYDNRTFPDLAQGQLNIASYWQFNFLKLYEKLGWSTNLSTSTGLQIRSYYLIDGVHPNAAGISLEANYVADYLKTFY